MNILRKEKSRVMVKDTPQALQEASQSPVLSFFKRLLYVLAIVLMILFAFQTNIYADGNYNGNGGHSSGGSGQSYGTVSVTHENGFRVYLYNIDTGSVISPVVDLWSATPSNVNKPYYDTRLGGGSASKHDYISNIHYDGGSGRTLPTPYNDAASHGAAVRAWFLYKDPTTGQNTNMSRFIQGVFDIDPTTLPNNTYCIIEALTWGQIANNDTSSPSGDVFYGTYYNLAAQYYPSHSYINPEVSGGYLRYKNDNGWKKWHQWLPNSLDLDDPADSAKLGLSVPKSTSATQFFIDIGNQGLGMHAFHVAGSDSITHTWDKKNCPKTPGKAPDDTSLYPAHDSDDPNYNCHIVKLYYDLKDDGKTPDETKPRVKDKNCFYRDLTCTKIEVEDEEEVGYRVMDWSTSYSSGNEWENVTHWSEVPTPIQKATKKTLLSTVTLKPNNVTTSKSDNTLYVLLVRTPNDTHTWDQPNHPDDPGPAPDDSDKYPPHDSDDKYYNNNIVKDYWIYDENGNPKTHVGTFHREKTAKNIQVEDEKEWKVKDWKTSNQYDPNISEWNVPGTIYQKAGNTTAYVKMDPEKGETTLYVLLIKSEVEDKEQPTDWDYRVYESQVSRGITLRVNDKGKNILFGHHFNWDYPAINDDGHGFSWHYWKVVDVKHHTDHHHDSIYDSKGNVIGYNDYDTHWDEDIWGWSSGGDKHSSTFWCPSYQFTDYRFQLGIKNKTYDDTKVASFGQKMVLNGTKVTGDNDHVFFRTPSGYSDADHDPGAQTGSGHTAPGGTIDDWDTSINTNGYDYYCVVYRGEDTLTFAEWKGASGAITGLSNFKVANKPQGRLSGKGGSKNGSYYISTEDYNFSDAGRDKTTTVLFAGGNPSTSEKNKDLSPTHIDPHSKSGSIGLNNPLSGSFGIKYFVFFGDENGKSTTSESGKIANDKPDGNYKHLNGIHDPLNLSVDGSKQMSGTMTKLGSFSFYPYVQMRWDSAFDSGKDTKIYVLGEYKRTMNVSGEAEVIWGRTSEANLNITSKQWSTSSQTKKDMKGMTAKGLQKALPGGAVFMMDTKNHDQKLYAVTYQPILTDAGEEQVKNTSSVPNFLTESSVTSRHTQYVKSVEKIIDDVMLEQFANNADSDPFGGKAVDNGSNISFLNNGIDNASSESKYYFNSPSINNKKVEGDLDYEEGSTKTEDHTFSTNVKGQLLMDDKVIIDKGGSVGSLSGIAKDINDRTQIVTHLWNSIQNNAGHDVGSKELDGGNPSGDDSALGVNKERAVNAPDWASDGKWYNEAFDGITIRITSTEITVGLKDPSVRSTVLDPKLIPQTTSKVGDKDKASYNDSAMRVRPTSGNVVGSYNKQKVVMDDMEWLFWSKRWYIPNQTVQDLR